MLEFFGVKPGLFPGIGQYEAVVDVPVPGELPKGEKGFLYEARRVTGSGPHRLLAFLDAPEIHQLVDQAQEALGVPVDNL